MGTPAARHSEERLSFGTERSRLLGTAPSGPLWGACRSLGLSIPKSVRARAHHVFQ